MKNKYDSFYIIVLTISILFSAIGLFIISPQKISPNHNESRPIIILDHYKDSLLQLNHSFEALAAPNKNYDEGGMNSFQDLKIEIYDVEEKINEIKIFTNNTQFQEQLDDLIVETQRLGDYLPYNEADNIEFRGILVNLIIESYSLQNNLLDTGNKTKDTKLGEKLQYLTVELADILKKTDKITNRKNARNEGEKDEPEEKPVFDTSIRVKKLYESNDSLRCIAYHISERKKKDLDDTSYNTLRAYNASTYIDTFRTDSFLVFAYRPQLPQRMNLDSEYNASLTMKVYCETGNLSYLVLDIILMNSPSNTYCSVQKERFDREIAVKDTATWKWHLKPQKKGSVPFKFLVYAFIEAKNYHELITPEPHEIIIEAKIISRPFFPAKDFFTKHWPEVVVALITAFILFLFKWGRTLFNKVRDEKNLNKQKSAPVRYIFRKKEEKI